MASLLDEIQQAVIWSRPSVLIAVHQSKNDQNRLMDAMESTLGSLAIQVQRLIPKSGDANILRDIVQEKHALEAVFFIHGLGFQSLRYDGLNLYREILVEQRLKLIFWLTLEEVSLLSHKAPDFWAFRNRVVEFPTKRSSRKNTLPSGVLLWHCDMPNTKVQAIYDEITFYKTLLQNIPSRNETVASHVEVIGNLAFYYWVAGENKIVSDLLHTEIDNIKHLQLNELYSLILNALAINTFDLGEYQESLRLIEQAVTLNPTNSILWSNLGIICRSAGQSRKSFPSLKKAIRLNPSSPESYGIMGYLYMSLGKYELALPLFEKALTIKPELFRFYPALAVCYLQTGNIEKFNYANQQIIDAAKDDEYLALCRDGLLSNKVAVGEQLKKIASGGKPMVALIRRDPNLHFIVSPEALQEVFD